MKKIFVLSLVMCLLFCGCASAPSVTPASGGGTSELPTDKGTVNGNAVNTDIQSQMSAGMENDNETELIVGEWEIEAAEVDGEYYTAAEALATLPSAAGDGDIRLTADDDGTFLFEYGASRFDGTWSLIQTDEDYYTYSLGSTGLLFMVDGSGDTDLGALFNTSDVTYYLRRH